MKAYIKPFLVMLISTACFTRWSPGDGLYRTALLVLGVGIVFCIVIPLPDYLSKLARNGKTGRIAYDLSKIVRDGLVFIGVLFLFLNHLHFGMMWAVVATLVVWTVYMTFVWLAEQAISAKNEDDHQL